MAIIRTLIGNVKGAKGDTGATGATGAQGEAATITVGTTTTAAYGTNASVTNSGTETDAVFDFVIPQGAPGDEVTDASNLTLNEITASTAQYPTFSVQEQLKTIFGKIQKFLSDIRTNGLFKSNLVNGFTQTTAGVNALDAAAGKSLNDALSNNLQIPITKISFPSGVSQTVNVPTGSRHLVVFADGFSSGEWIGYIFSTGSGSTTAAEIFKGSHISSVTVNGTAITFTSTASSATTKLVDFVINGDPITT